jgi:choline dehydrogenase-like flavoprotein
MYGSAKLLQLSGIGPADVLESITGSNIDQILADLPVGQKTQLRPFGVAMGVYTGRPLDTVANTTLLTTEARAQFLAGKGGPYGKATSATLGKSDTLGYHTTGFTAVGAPDMPFFTAACFLNPVTFGNLTIANASDPFAAPIIHSNLLGDPRDFVEAVACVERLRNVINSFPPDFGMVEAGPTADTPTEAWVAATASTCWHFIGGCAVGSVVDGDFKVMGDLKKLRVIDASVIPVMPRSGGLLASVYMLSEFASDNLVKEYASIFAAPVTNDSTLSPGTTSPAPPPSAAPTEATSSGPDNMRFVFSSFFITAAAMLLRAL